MVVPKELREKRNFQHQDHGRPQANVGEWLEKSDCNLPSESLQFPAEACATSHDVKGLHHKVLRNLKHFQVSFCLLNFTVIGESNVRHFEKVD